MRPDIDLPPPLLRPQRFVLRTQALITLALGCWFIAAPWVLDTLAPTTTRSAAYDNWIVGGVIALLSLWQLLRPSALWATWLIALLGAWIFVAPWVLGYDRVHLADYNSWAVGAVIAIVGSWAVMLTGGGVRFRV